MERVDYRFQDKFDVPSFLIVTATYYFRIPCNFFFNKKHYI